MTLLDDTVAAVRPLDETAMARARAHQDDLTKPPGSLGRLEELAVQLAGVRGRGSEPLGARAVAVFVGDHGVTRQGVSAYPAEVTPQMVGNFLRGGAAVNALARQVGAEVVVVDVGVAADVAEQAGLLSRRVRPGTGDITREPAMTPDEARRALEVGIEVARQLAAGGVDALAVGDMGIGNTTAASAVVAAVTGAVPAAVCGRGTGVDDAGLARKVTAVARALDRAAVAAGDGLAVLAELGGLEIAAITGAVLGAAASRMLCVLDGHPATAGALVAALLCPSATAHCVAGHRSAERGHAVALAQLGLRPLLDLDLRLGEGTGALLALGVVDAAARLSAEMATFSGAGVSGPTVDAAAGEPAAELPTG